MNNRARMSETSCSAVFRITDSSSAYSWSNSTSNFSRFFKNLFNLPPEKKKEVKPDEKKTEEKK